MKANHNSNAAANTSNALYSIIQRYKNESKSQQNNLTMSKKIGCIQ